MDLEPSKKSPPPVPETIQPGSMPSDQEQPTGTIAGHDVTASRPDTSLSEQLTESQASATPTTKRIPTLPDDGSNLLPVSAEKVKAGSLLIAMIENNLIKVDPQLTARTKVVMRNMPKTEEDILPWASKDESFASAALYAGIMMVASPAPMLQDLGKYAIMCASTYQPVHCTVMISFWAALQCLNKTEWLTSTDQRLIPELFSQTRDYGLPTGRWMHDLSELGLIKKLPPGDPVTAIDSLLLLRIDFQALPEDQDPVGYHQDPVVFDELDRLPRANIAPDLSFLKNLTLADPQCFYNLVPVIMAASLEVPSSSLLTEQLNNLSEDTPLPVRQLANNLGYCFYLLLHLQKKRILRMGKQMRSVKKDFPDIADEMMMALLHPSADEGKFSKELSEYIDNTSRKNAVRLKNNLETLLESRPAPTPELQALLLVQLGKLHEVQLIKSEKPFAKACSYYQRACQLVPSKSFVQNIESKLVKSLEYRQAADFLTSMEAVLEDKSYLELKIRQYHQTAEAFEHWSEKTSRQDVDQLFTELEQAGSSSATRKQKKKVKKRHPGQGADSLLADSSTSIDSASSSASESSKTKSTPVTASTDSKPRKPDHETLLTRRWHPDIFKVLRIALYYRYGPEDHEKEKQILTRNIGRLEKTAGVERLHEELAWHNIRQQREIIKQAPNAGEMTPDIRAISKKMLDAAEQHLYKALERKLRVSAGEAKKLYNNDGWQEVADSVYDSFRNEDDRRCYSNGIKYLMSSLGHVYSERSQHLATGPTRKNTQWSWKGYAGKTFKS